MNQETTFELNGILFVWNKFKARANVAKHGVTFERAVNAFFDPFLSVVDADREGESRNAILGMDEGWNLLFVVHLELEDDSFRIISARRATKRDRLKYET